MKQITSTNWMPFVIAGVLSVIVGLFLVVLVRRRNK
jgi:LPXTG-motif cell wall-anchored protein